MRFALGAPALVAALAAVTATDPAGATVPRPSLDSRAAILVDARGGEVLLAERATERRPIASATKLMTALLTIERAETDDVFTAPAYRPRPGESVIGLRRGERMEVRDLLGALLLESANDAAVTIAVGVARSRPAFVEAMNRRARELGLDATSYANPIGFDDPRNHSSARDLAALARRLMRDPRFADIVGRESFPLRSGAKPRVARNRNPLPGRLRAADGVKTGHTSGAGHVLVGSATRGGTRVVSVVLGEPSEAARDRDSVALLRYGLDQFRRRTVVRAGAAVARVRVKEGDDRVALTTREDIALTVRRGERVQTRVSAPRSLDGPLPEGERVGSVAVVHRGEVVRRAPLVTAEEVPGQDGSGGGGSGPSRLVAAILALAALLAAGLAWFRVRGRRSTPAGRA